MSTWARITASLLLLLIVAVGLLGIAPSRQRTIFYGQTTSTSGGGGGATFAFVAEQTLSGTTIVLTCQTGELCVLTVYVKPATGTVSGIADSTLDSWTHATGANSPNNTALNEMVDVWYLSQPPHSGSHNLTITAGGSGASITRSSNQEFTGQFTGGSPLDVCATGQGTVVNPSVSITAGTSNELLIAGMVSDNSTVTAGTGFTMGTGSPGSSNFYEYWERNLASVSGSNTAGFTRSSATNYSLSACAFKHN